MGLVNWLRSRYDNSVDLAEFINEYLEENKGTAEIINLDMFSDERIDATTREYNYDYGRLLRMLTSLIDSNSLFEIMIENKIDFNSFIIPNYESFEMVRRIIVNGKTNTK